MYISNISDHIRIATDNQEQQNLPLQLTAIVPSARTRSKTSLQVTVEMIIYKESLMHRSVPDDQVGGFPASKLYNNDIKRAGLFGGPIQYGVVNTKLFSTHCQDNTLQYHINQLMHNDFQLVSVSQRQN